MHALPISDLQKEASSTCPRTISMPHDDDDHEDDDGHDVCPVSGRERECGCGRGHDHRPVGPLTPWCPTSCHSFRKRERFPRSIFIASAEFEFLIHCLLSATSSSSPGLDLNLDTPNPLAPDPNTWHVSFLKFTIAAAVIVGEFATPTCLLAISLTLSPEIDHVSVSTHVPVTLRLRNVYTTPGVGGLDGSFKIACG